MYTCDSIYIGWYIVAQRPCSTSICRIRGHHYLCGMCIYRYKHHLYSIYKAFLNLVSDVKYRDLYFFFFFLVNIFIQDGKYTTRSGTGVKAASWYVWTLGVYDFIYTRHGSSLFVVLCPGENTGSWTKLQNTLLMIHWWWSRSPRYIDEE